MMLLVRPQRYASGRIRFEQESGPVESPPQGQCFFYYGKDVAGFRNVFTSIGLVVTTMTEPSKRGDG
jgi:hypothetical protein